MYPYTTSESLIPPPDPENSDKPITWNIKTWQEIIIFIISILVVTIPLFSFADIYNPLHYLIFSYSFYIILFFLLYKLARRRNIDWSYLIGTVWAKHDTWKVVLAPVFLLFISYASIYILYYPLSFEFPDFVNGWILEDYFDLLPQKGDNFMLANLLSFLYVVGVAPFVEEIFFRGFLLTSMSVKWGVKKGIIFSSLIFCIVDDNILGAFIISAVLSILYINTKSLLAPILVHVLNNIITFIWNYLSLSLYGSRDPTISEFQSKWWLALIAFMISVPWLIYFYRKEIKRRKFEIPYLTP